MKIRVIDIIHETAADGPGLRTSIYCAGCKHHCKGCHNPETWDFNAGKEVDVNDILQEILEDPFADVTFTGGDPMFQVEAFTELAKLIKKNSNKTIWLYTGFTIDQIKASKHLSQILPYIDAVVDGPYMEEYKDINLIFRGSSNQNIITVKEII